MTAILDRQLTPCTPVRTGLGCARSALTTTTTTTPRAADDDVCPLTGKDSCPSDQATIDTCGAC